MNISEIEIQDRVVVQRTATEKEIATIKVITKEGKILARNSFGDIEEIAPSQIIKKLSNQ